jgi:hypothetical protein
MSSVRGGFFQRNLSFFEGQIGCKCVGYKDLWKNPRGPDSQLLIAQDVRMVEVVGIEPTS